MKTFRDSCRARRVASIAVFGDSITVGAGASSPEASWAALLAASLGARLINRGISGTVLQSTPIADGRGGSGVSRFRADLLGDDRADAIAILYGYNDARYTADPANFNVAAFTRDYRTVLDGLLAYYASDAIAPGSPPWPTDKGLTLGSTGFTGQTRAGVELYRDAVRALAHEYGLHYAPVYERMSEHRAGALASPDHVHPNDRGHRVIFEAFASAAIIPAAP